MRNQNVSTIKTVGEKKIISAMILIFDTLCRNKYLAGLVLDLSLTLGTLLYRLSSVAAIRFYGGHPKRRLTNYQNWFSDQINTTSTVLDVGSNTGGLSRLLAEKALSVTGIEINQNYYRKAIAVPNPPNLDFVHGDVTGIEISGNFNTVILSNVIEHIEDRQRILKKLHSLLIKNNSSRQDLRLLVRVPMLNKDWLTPLKLERGLEWRIDPDHYIEYSEEILRNEIEKGGFSIISVRIAFGEIFVVARPIQIISE